MPFSTSIRCHDPTGSQWPLRSMTTQQRTLESRVVKRAERACHQVDADARVVSYTEDADGVARLRMRAGDAHSLEAMREALTGVLPLSTTLVTENFMDGTLEVEVLVLTRAQERWHARHAVSKERLVAYWLLLAWVALFLGLGGWSSSVRRFVRKDEL